jgi:hypothetical protein
MPATWRTRLKDYAHATGVKCTAASQYLCARAPSRQALSCLKASLSLLTRTLVASAVSLCRHHRPGACYPRRYLSGKRPAGQRHLHPQCVPPGRHGCLLSAHRAVDPRAPQRSLETLLLLRHYCTRRSVLAEHQARWNSALARVCVPSGPVHPGRPPRRQPRVLRWDHTLLRTCAHVPDLAVVIPHALVSPKSVEGKEDDDDLHQEADRSGQRVRIVG